MNKEKKQNIYALFLLVVLSGCFTAPEVQFMKDSDKINLLSVSNNKLVIQTRYTLPLMNVYATKTGNEPKENVLTGAKDICLGLVNVIGTIAEPWVAAIPIVGYVSAAVVQKVGDTKFYSNTIEIPLDDINSCKIVFETDGGRNDVKYIEIVK